MFPSIRIALGAALLLVLITSITVFAKGSFSFITVTGPTLKEPIRLTDPVLLSDFFFSQSTIEAPSDPGIGYEITRYLAGAEAFDKLHYYPDTGFIYYDGIVNGSSGDDGNWHLAMPDIKSIFENALATQIRLVSLGNEAAAKALVPPPQPQTSRLFAQPQLSVSIAVTVGLVMMLGFVIWRRRSSVR